MEHFCGAKQIYSQIHLAGATKGATCTSLRSLNPPVPPLLLTPEGWRPGELLIICSSGSLLHWPLNGQQAFYYLLRHQSLNNNR